MVAGGRSGGSGKHGWWAQRRWRRDGQQCAFYSLSSERLSRSECKKTWGKRATTQKMAAVTPFCVAFIWAIMINTISLPQIILTMKNDRQTLRASKWHDYFSPGFYMLTMVTEERRPLLGTLVGSCAEDARVELSALGESVLETIMRTGEDFPEVEVVAQTILPDHIHVLLQVKNSMQHHLGEVVKTWKNQTTKCYLHHENHRTLMLNVTEQYEPREHARQQERLAVLQLWLKDWDGQGRAPEHDTLSSLQEEALWVVALRERGCEGGDGGRQSRPQQRARDQREQQWTPDGDRLPVRLVPPLWEKGYHDRIVRHNGQIARLKRYIDRNPGRLWSKRHAERRLVEVHEVRVMLPIEAAQQLKDMAVWFDQRRTLQAGTMAHQDAALTSYVELMQQCLRRGADGGTPFLRFYGCGNDELLDMGRPLMQLRVSRSVPEGEFMKALTTSNRCQSGTGLRRCSVS